MGDGPLDLVVVPAWINQIEHAWTHPPGAEFMGRLAAFARLITFDRRGTGLSDPMVEPLSLEEQVDDVTAVMDAAGSERAAVFAASEGSAMACLFAAAHPERVQALALYAPQARFSPAPGYEWPMHRRAAQAASWSRCASTGVTGRPTSPCLRRAPGRIPSLREWFARAGAPGHPARDAARDPPDGARYRRARGAALDPRAHAWSCTGPRTGSMDPRHVEYMADAHPGRRDGGAARATRR